MRTYTYLYPEPGDLTDVYTDAELAATRAVEYVERGLLESKNIAAMAEVHYCQIAPHVYCGPVVAAASVQLAICSPNFLIQEGMLDWGGFHAELLKKPINWEAGYAIPSTEPGVGIELDERVA